MTKPFETDVAIIGAGPVGLFAIFECGMVGLKCHVIDALEIIGGQCTALYPEKPIYDIPAHPAISGAGLVENLEAQAESFEPVYHLDQQVTDLAEATLDGEKAWHLKTSKGTEIIAKAVIIAGGVGAFGPNKPPLPNLEDYEGASIFYAVLKRDQFKDKRIVIGGGGDSAVDWALSLSEIAAEVYLVHRRDKFRAAPDSVNKLRALHEAGKIELVVPYQLAGLSGENGQLTGVSVKSMGGEMRELPADYLLPFFGLSMNLGPIADWGLELEKKQLKIDPTTCETNQPGIYAIGDIATYPNKLKLILCGFSEAALAAHRIRHQIYPDQAFHFEYSTTKGVPGGTSGQAA